ncbi:tryptophan 2,3-dioxygenase family protein [Reichenbachiella sp.]
MTNSKFDSKILDQLQKLEEKYEAMGQDLSSYLDGLLHADYLTYWDYIHLDTLLSLQNPKTQFPDEKIFIIYHQITELYFKLILNEIEQLAFDDEIDANQFLLRINRINRYLLHLVDSFDVMIDGMDQKQFLDFRMSLLPASGFQSAQIRMFEISCTDLLNLVEESKRPEMKAEDLEEMYNHLYWKRGATELATGKKTLTLKQFENKYSEEFLKLANKYKSANIWKKYEVNYKSVDQKVTIVEALRKLDQLSNVQWRLAHYKSAVRYLQRDPEVIAATGGTNWQKYLPPRFQRVIFFPELWSQEEKDNWGKSWVDETVFKK